jgi:1-deoxy-D-xylulose-5-phosphate reductoisomerase
VKKVSILGATGSIGKSTLDLIERSPGEFEVVALTASVNVGALADAARRTNAKMAVIADEERLPELEMALQDTHCRAAAGTDALVEAAAGDAELVVAAIVGCAGLKPTMAAVEAGKTVALANKEALVTAGDLMTEAVRKNGATLLPVDSEHNAIFQSLAGSRIDQVSRIILTASGGPFRTATAEHMRDATPAQAVAHPNWSMGAKISVDSATLMNKGLELIEAHYLFGLPFRPHRHSRAPAVRHPLSGRICGRVGASAAGLARHADSYRLCSGLAGQNADAGTAARPRRDIASRLRRTGPGTLSRAASGPRSSGDSRVGTRRTQRRQ